MQQSQLGMPAPLVCQDLDASINGKHKPAEQEARKASLGLSAHASQAFISNVEFVSLGNYCAVASALQALGMRKYAYPFDWVRSSVNGIIHLLENSFADFFDYDASEMTAEHGVVYKHTPWGGSFWHHDIKEADVKACFKRRIDRMMGKGEVPGNVPRVFVRTLNSSAEVDSCLDLHKALQKVFSGAKVYLLILLDMQDQSGPLRLPGSSDKILFYRVPLSAALTADLDSRAQGYWPALACAVRHWAGHQDDVTEVPTLRGVRDMIDSFDGGNAASALYAPRRLPNTPPTPLPPPVVARHNHLVTQSEVNKNESALPMAKSPVVQHRRIVPTEALPQPYTRRA
eukprot:2738539-Amphidinium_carterae.1